MGKGSDLPQFKPHACCVALGYSLSLSVPPARSGLVSGDLRGRGAAEDKEPWEEQGWLWAEATGSQWERSQLPQSRAMKIS